MAGKKRKSQGGFTLVEMLIVVAVIAILIAVSIPMVTSTLEKSRVAVDQANERDAQSLAAAWYLTADQQERKLASNDGTRPYWLVYTVDAESHQGKIGMIGVPYSGYGLSTAERGFGNGAVKKSPKGRTILIKMDTDGTIITLEWVDPGDLH